MQLDLGPQMRVLLQQAGVDSRVACWAAAISGTCPFHNSEQCELLLRATSVCLNAAKEHVMNLAVQEVNEAQPGQLAPSAAVQKQARQLSSCYLPLIAVPLHVAAQLPLTQPPHLLFCASATAVCGEALSQWPALQVIDCIARGAYDHVIVRELDCTLLEQDQVLPAGLAAELLPYALQRANALSPQFSSQAPAARDDCVRGGSNSSSMQCSAVKIRSSWLCDHKSGTYRCCA
jgi:hypothetical protein